MIDLNAIAGDRYKVDWDVYRGIDVIHCQHGEIGIWSGAALYACTRDGDIGSILQGMDGVRVRGWMDQWGRFRLVVIFEPTELNAVAEVMGAERHDSEAEFRPQHPRSPG